MANPHGPPIWCEPTADPVRAKRFYEARAQATGLGGQVFLSAGGVADGGHVARVAHAVDAPA
jgi:hypothetical protein